MIVAVRLPKDLNLLFDILWNNLERRLYEHKHELVEGFTKRYHVHKLVYYEVTTDARAAIAREKQIKRWTRTEKNKLISAANPGWNDLSEDW